jgi:putative ABC transport system permease protein
MSWWTDFRERVRGLFLRARADRELEDELRFHVEMDVAARMRAGSSAADARHAAERAFGGIDRFREETRDARGVRPVEDFVYDVRYALRALGRNPGFTLAAVLVLALGIGANTAIFSAVNAVVLRPLPFAQPDRLYMLWEENPEKNWYQQVSAPANMLDWQERVRAFEDVAGYTIGGRRVLTGRGQPQIVRTAQVTGNFFSVLGVPALHGPGLEPEETWETGQRSIVISHGLWSRAFGSEPGVVGQLLTLDGVDFRISGVMPAGFAFPTPEVDVWQPMGWAKTDRSQIWFRRAHWIRPIARLKPGVTSEEANSQLQAVVAQLKVEYPQTNRVMGAGMTPLQEFLVGSTRKPLVVLLGAVGLLLLIGCANVGNLLLVKAAGRQREMAVRSALGAGRFRLVRQLMTESLVLSLFGGVAGLLLGMLGTRSLVRLLPAGLLPDSRLGIDGVVVAFVTLITIACGLIFGSVPAAWAHRAAASSALKEGGRAGSLGRSARAVAGTLVMGEVAVAMMLVVGAGLLVRSFQQLLQVNPGFDASGVLAVNLSLPSLKYDTPEKEQAFYEQLLERARGLPGVADVAATSTLPLTQSGYTSDFFIFGRRPDEYGSEVVHRSITPGYQRVMRVPILRGRSIEPTDRKETAPVVVINEALAKKFFPNGDPIGQRIAFDRVPDTTSVWYTIVGVAGSERQAAVARDAQIEVLEAFAQSRYGSMSLVFRTTGDPMALRSSVESLVKEIDPNLPLFDVRLMETVRLESVARERFLMVLLGLFAVVAMLLAVVGVYGVTAQFMKQRTQEIGVRLALGAEPAAVQRLMVSRGAGLVGGGILLGIAGAVAGSRAMVGLLYNVKPMDPLTFGVVALTLAAAGTLAAWLPARRASRVDPLNALRPE